MGFFIDISRFTQFTENLGMNTARNVSHEMIETQIGSRLVRPGVSDSDSASLQRGHGLNICCCRFKLVSVSPTRRKIEKDEAIRAILPGRNTSFIVEAEKLHS